MMFELHKNREINKNDEAFACLYSWTKESDISWKRSQWGGLVVLNI